MSAVQQVASLQTWLVKLLERLRRNARDAAVQQAAAQALADAGPASEARTAGG